MAALHEHYILGREVVLSELLGSGANGSVFLATPICASGAAGEFPYPPRFVVKVIRRDVLPASSAKMVLKEINAIRSLEHPFIVRYVGAWVEAGGGEHGGSVCLAMTYCDGGDLHGLIREYSLRGEYIPNELAMVIILQVLSALSHSHAQHIIHRDIKPANLLLVRDGSGTSVEKTLVGDYGLARPLQQTTELARTRVGTPCYCSPEIVSGEPYSSKTDIFSAGATFFELLTRERAFWRKHYTEQQSFYAILHVDPTPRLRQMTRGRYETCLVRAVEACLCKHEKDRPAAADLLTTFASRLTTCVREKGIPVSREGAKVSPLRATAESPVRRISPVTPVCRTPTRPGTNPPRRKVSPKCVASPRALLRDPPAVKAAPAEEGGGTLVGRLLGVVEAYATDKAELEELRRLLGGDTEALLIVQIFVSTRCSDRDSLENALFKLLLTLKPKVSIEPVMSWLSRRLGDA
ncbi:unnamed protein product [Trypanosoma congolense IL3000]|uniref:WGS project CAEQ00000000 data, annotated contig 2387 n=1 Tax=Trypanosoma congolense (strain IL3000) TaxID=1068625 RepID=F9WDP9_TRYCI|nr:unnamed protein product [Trypanosoma congolense IL3000]